MTNNASAADSGADKGTWVIYSDGASRGNPGPAALGAVVLDPAGVVKHEASEALGITTNNVAEYRGLIAGLEAALELGARRIEVRMDSELIVRQVIGRYRVKSPALVPYYKQVLGLRARFDEAVFLHVPREQNKHADALANRALDQGSTV